MINTNKLGKCNQNWSSIARQFFFLLSICFFTVVASISNAAGDKFTDDMFNEPYIDVDEWRDEPVRHRYVHGGFKGTKARFSFYYPPKAQYQGRFYQHITPVPDSENLAAYGEGEENKLGFAIDSGAYFVETNQGGNAPGRGDPTIGAFRVNAAAAVYSREVAAAMYGKHRPYGYAYGGSGGAFRTAAGIENTTGVWDGVVPYVMGSPMSIPNVFTVRLHAMRVLKDKFPGIVDAMDVGGSGDMYAGLNEEEKAALEEVTRMGFPSNSWFEYDTMGQHAFPVLFQVLLMIDPGYFKDFWTVPGYLGANPPESLLRARIQHATTIKQAVSTDEAEQLGMDLGRVAGQARGGVDTAFEKLKGNAEQDIPFGFRLEKTLANGTDVEGATLSIKTGAAAGKSIQLRELKNDVVSVGPSDKRVLLAIKPGDKVEIDNSNFLAAQTYHRHQVPGPGFPVWDQFRDEKGEPIYPQRPRLVGPLMSRGATGVLQTGRFEGKVILVETLMDREAYPWQADWYRTQVKKHLGDELDNNFRLWFVERALHGDFSEQVTPTQTISYIGVLQQALRDLSAWVEKDIPPPASTQYQVVDGQVLVPAGAQERRGLQPVVAVKANGVERAEVAVGESVKLLAEVALPEGAGTIVSAEWDFDGSGEYTSKVKLDGKSANPLLIKTSTQFSKPGTYFPTLRVASQRQSDGKTAYARIQNLGRVRVIVK